MSQPLVAIDIDDVIANSTDALRMVVNSHLGISLSSEDYRSVKADYWGYYEVVWREHGVHEKVSFSEIEKGMEDDQSHVMLLAGAQLAITELASKYDIVLVTSRDQKLEKATKSWLKNVLPGLNVDIHFAINYSAGNDKKSKGQICRELGAVWLIDDNPGHCKSALDSGLSTILFGDYGWSTKVPKGAIRCVDWPEVLDTLL